MIEDSNEWKFNRRIFIDNKLYGSINQGTLTWNKKDNSTFICQEKGILELNNGENGIFFSSLKFIFNNQNYQVFKNDNTLFYHSNKNNKYSSKTGDVLIELKIIDNIITFRYDLHSKKGLKTEITNYMISKVDLKI